MTDVLLRIRVEGPDVEAGQMNLRDLIHLGRQFQTALDRTARVLIGQISVQAGRPVAALRQSTTLRVLGIERGSFDLLMGLPREQLALPGLDIGEQALETLLLGLEHIATLDPELPRGYDLGVLVAWRDLGKLINHGIERISFDVRTSRTDTHVVYDYPLQARVIERIAGPEANQVVMEGRLLMADFKETGLRCRLHPPGDQPVLCTFDEEMADQVGDALRHYVRVKGIAEIDPVTGGIRSLNIRDLEILDYREDVKPRESTLVSRYPPVEFWAGASVTELAEIQGVSPLQRLDDVLADFWPAEESLDDFVETIRRWRHEDRET